MGGFFVEWSGFIVVSGDVGIWKRYFFLICLLNLPVIAAAQDVDKDSETVVAADLVSEEQLQKIEALRQQLQSEISSLLEKGKGGLSEKLTPEQRERLEELKRKQEELLEDFKAFWKTGKPADLSDIEE